MLLVAFCMFAACQRARISLGMNTATRQVAFRILVGARGAHTLLCRFAMSGAGGGSSSSTAGRPRAYNAPISVIRAAKCSSSKLAPLGQRTLLGQPVAQALLEPLVQGGPAARVQRQAQAVISECGAENVSAATRRLAALGTSGRYPNNIERELHNLIRKNCPFKVDVTTVRLSVVDTRSARAFYQKKKKRFGKKAPAPVVKDVDWPVQGPRLFKGAR